MSPPLKLVSVWHVRRLFNNGKFWSKVQSGEFTTSIRNSRPAPPEANQLPNTLSQMVEYRNLSGDRVALVHQYLQVDFKLGGSGYPDPKQVLVDGIIYAPKIPPEDGLLRIVHFFTEWLNGIWYKTFG
jgi:hypothetical protein